MPSRNPARGTCSLGVRKGIGSSNGLRPPISVRVGAYSFGVVAPVLIGVVRLQSSPGPRRRSKRQHGASRSNEWRWLWPQPSCGPLAQPACNGVGKVRSGRSPRNRPAGSGRECRSIRYRHLVSPYTVVADDHRNELDILQARYWETAEQVAKQKHVVYINLGRVFQSYAAESSARLLTSDTVHPCDAGGKLIAAALERIILPKPADLASAPDSLRSNTESRGSRSGSAGRSDCRNRIGDAAIGCHLVFPASFPIRRA
jgi:hypothetical protein